MLSVHVTNYRLVQASRCVSIVCVLVSMSGIILLAAEVLAIVQHAQVHLAFKLQQVLHSRLI